MPGCVAVGCTNRSEQGFVMKVFPKDPRRKAEWEAKVKRLNWVASKNSYLCEEHFDLDQWQNVEKEGKKKLKRDANPTLFIHTKTENKRKVPTPRELPVKRLKLTEEEIDKDKIESLSISLKKANQEIKKLKLENDKLRKRMKKLRNLYYKRDMFEKRHFVNSEGKCIFAADQIQSLKRQRPNWSNSTVQTALSLRFSCGTTGYENILALNLPYPSVRTLQRRLQNLKFESGILYEVIEFLKIKVSSFKNNLEKEAVLLLDEMSITSSIDYDPSSSSYIGEATFPECEGIAKDALVIMVGGISTPWKQTVAYYFTNDEADGLVLKTIVLKVIKKIEEIGLRINSVTSDMSSFNQAMWKHFGVGYTSKIKKSFIVHPYDSTRLIYFFADPPHLLKNVRTSLFNNSHFIIPDEFVLKYNLPSAIVSAEHLNQLHDFQKNLDLKPAPKINDEHFQLKHFNKMKVNLAHNILSHDVGCALEFMSEINGNQSVKSTAWFVKTVSRWFDLLSSRNPVTAISKFKPAVYDETISFLEEICRMFQELKIVQKDGRVVWKPIQTGILLTTISILKLQKYLLLEKKFNCIFTARFSQDCLENLFSVIRSKQTIPSAVEFKNNLKLISVAQYMRKSNSSNYTSDERELLSGFLDVIKARKQSLNTKKIVLPLDWDKNTSEDLNLAERNCLYSIAGYIIYSLKKNTSCCEECLSSLGSKEKINCPDSQLVAIREYKSNCLYYANENVFKIFVIMEMLFRSLEDILMNKTNCKKLLTEKYLSNETIKNFSLPECHNIKEKLINRFSSFRLKIFGKKKRRELTNATNKALKSKSVAMHNLANAV